MLAIRNASVPETLMVVLHRKQLVFAYSLTEILPNVLPSCYTYGHSVQSVFKLIAAIRNYLWFALYDTYTSSISIRNRMNASAFRDLWARVMF